MGRGGGLPLVGIDNLPGSRPLEGEPLPEACVLLFGQEGPGLSPAARDVVADVRSIAQFGSTRSINAAVAAGIAMHRWIVTHRRDGPGPDADGPTLGAAGSSSLGSTP